MFIIYLRLKARPGELEMELLGQHTPITRPRDRYWAQVAASMGAPRYRYWFIWIITMEKKNWRVCCTFTKECRIHGITLT